MERKAECARIPLARGRLSLCARGGRLVPVPRSSPALAGVTARIAGALGAAGAGMPGGQVESFIRIHMRAGIVRTSWQSSTRPPRRGCSYPIPKGSTFSPSVTSKHLISRATRCAHRVPRGFPSHPCASWLAQSCLAGISWPHHAQWIPPNGSPPLALLHLSWQQNPLQADFQSS